MARTTGSKTRDFPARTLEKSLVIIEAIADSGAGKSMDRLLVAQAINRTPASSEFKRLLSSSSKYGLTVGGEKADEISPTQLGLKIAKPQNDAERLSGIAEAASKPPLLEAIYNHFNKSKLPQPSFLKNTLERSFSVEPNLSEELASLLVENAEFSGLLQEISGSKYLNLAQVGASSSAANDDEGATFSEDEIPVDEPADTTETPAIPNPDIQNPPAKPKKIFVAHGKNHKPLDALKKILSQFKIPHAVAIDEPNKGRPISKKVAQLMEECSAGIFIFTKDAQFFDKDENEIWRPSENVVYELGAANILWDQKIIILKAEGVTFPSDFSDLGYIEFEGNDLTSKTIEILNELVGLELVKIQAA